MHTSVISGVRSRVSEPAALVAATSAIATILLLASLHALSPEFDPSWRVVSEYANGSYGWVLSLMFLVWALSNWALAYELRSEMKTQAGRIGLLLLIVSGIGEAMASIFDIRHPLHNLAGALGVPTMPIAASLISLSLCRVQPWSAAKRLLLWTSTLIWISLILLIATLAILVITLHHVGGRMGAHLQQLPPGVIALDGWANRLYIVACCVWMITAARQSFMNKAG